MNKPVTIPPVLTPQNKCGFCTGSWCCTYFTQHIDTPRSMEDFDTLLWQVSHENTELYRDDDGWFLLITTRCQHLGSDGRCGIYETRPQVCREHSNDNCEFEGLCGPDDFDLYFRNHAELDAWCRKRYKKWDKRFKKFEKNAG